MLISHPIRAAAISSLGFFYLAYSDVRARLHQMKRPYRSYVSMSGLNSHATGTMSKSNALLIGNVSTGKMTNNTIRVGLTWDFNAAANQTANDYLTKK